MAIASASTTGVGSMSLEEQARPCVCRHNRSTCCGKEKDDDDNLREDCTLNTVYRCTRRGTNAEQLGVCKRCIESDEEGRDHCHEE